MEVHEHQATRYYPNFDWLRLAFALQVVAIHCGLTSTVFVNPVPAFLAISGFVVLGSIERRSIGQFFLGRALRVLPLLFFSFIAIGSMCGWASMQRNIEYWIWPSGIAPVNPVVWSLIYEEVFYLLLALLFIAGLYRRKWQATIVAAAVVGLTAKYHFIGVSSLWYLLGSAFFIGNVVYLFRHEIQARLGK